LVNFSNNPSEIGGFHRFRSRRKGEVTPHSIPPHAPQRSASATYYTPGCAIDAAAQSAAARAARPEPRAGRMLVRGNRVMGRGRSQTIGL